MKITDYYKEENYIHYSNCHEDAKLLLQGITKENCNILSICSALDNSLTLLLSNPKRVLAIDSNPTQIYLAKLKKTAIKYLNYTEFLIFLGFKEGDSWAYFERISPFLEEETRHYFLEHKFLIAELKLVNCGRFEHYFQIFRKRVLPLIHRQKVIYKFMNFSNLKEQISYYEESFNNLRFKLLFKIFFSEFLMKRLGRDKAYFKYNKDPLAKKVKCRFERGIYNNLNNNNPYLQYIIFNEFRTLPLYLQTENFQLIKERIDRLEIKEATLEATLLTEEKFDFMNLSDVFEYVAETKMPYYEQLLANSLEEKGRIIYWNMLNDRFLKHFKWHYLSNLKDLAFYYKRVLYYEKPLKEVAI